MVPNEHLWFQHHTWDLRWDLSPDTLNGTPDYWIFWAYVRRSMSVAHQVPQLKLSVHPPTESHAAMKSFKVNPVLNNFICFSL